VEVDIPAQADADAMSVVAKRRRKAWRVTGGTILSWLVLFGKLCVCKCKVKYHRKIFMFQDIFQFISFRFKTYFFFMTTFS